MTNSRICFVFPSRSRTVRFFQTLDNIRAMSNSNNYFVWSKLDLDDETMNRPEIIKHLAEKYPEVTIKWATSENKVHAINRDMEDLPECDIMILQSDDVVWDVKGFDDAIRQAFQDHFPDFSGAVHIPDDHGGKSTIIVSILGINLYKKLGYIYCPEYENLFADNEFTDVVKMLKKHVFIDKRLFSHNHPIWKTAPWDALYRANENPENYKRDREVYLRRQVNRFGL